LDIALSVLNHFGSKILLDPEGSKNLLEATKEMANSAAVVIGGEKGLSDAELKLCHKHGYSPIRLGKNILRATTASISVATILSMIDQN
jgi:16S rRNA (uracil1498-N3)-methyltransferase